MSAFVVEDKTINRVVTYLHDVSMGPYSWLATVVKDAGYDVSTREGCERLGAAMFDLNCQAVNERYGPNQAQEFRPLDYNFNYIPSCGIPAFVALECWKYQCTEGVIPQTELYRLMETVYHGLAVSIVHTLDGYKRAAWG